MPCRRRWDCCQPRPRCFSSSDTGQDNGGAAANVDFQRQQSQRGLPTALCVRFFWVLVLFFSFMTPFCGVVLYVFSHMGFRFPEISFHSYCFSRLIHRPQKHVDAELAWGEGLSAGDLLSLLQYCNNKSMMNIPEGEGGSS